MSIPQKAEEERKKKEKKNKEANAVWQSSSRFFKEFGDRLAEAEKLGIFDDQAEVSGEKGLFGCTINHRVINTECSHGWFQPVSFDVICCHL